MSATIKRHPRARHVTLPQRAALLLTMAADAAQIAADATGHVHDRLRAELLTAAQCGQWSRVMILAVQIEQHEGARSE